MYEVLRDLSQELLLPGLGHVPPNTVTLLETNAKFVESFMAGLNTEMGRELLWRGFPTDQRGTYFRQFWEGAQRDIEPIDQWGARPLGENLLGPRPGREPRALDSRRSAEPVSERGDLRSQGDRKSTRAGLGGKYPIFRGTLQPDITFLGFDLTSGEATKDRRLVLHHPGTADRTALWLRQAGGFRRADSRVRGPAAASFAADQAACGVAQKLGSYGCHCPPAARAHRHPRDADDSVKTCLCLIIGSFPRRSCRTRCLRRWPRSSSRATGRWRFFRCAWRPASFRSRMARSSCACGSIRTRCISIRTSPS